MGDTRDRYGTSGFADALGLTIKVLRTDRGIERKDLADRAGISYSHLSSIEAGQKQPSPQALTAIAEALGIASHELLESVERRRSRRRQAGGDPWWLTGETEPATTPPAPLSAMPMARRPERANHDPAELADFIHEMSTLAEHLGPKERAVLLDLGRKLSRR